MKISVLSIPFAIGFALTIFNPIDADNLNEKELNYINKTDKSLEKAKGNPVILEYILSPQDVSYLKEKESIIVKNKHLSQDKQDDLIAEHKKKFFGGYDDSINLNSK